MAETRSQVILSSGCAQLSSTAMQWLWRHPAAVSLCSSNWKSLCCIQDGVIFHELRRKIPNETQEDFYARILQVMAQMGGGSANVL